MKSIILILRGHLRAWGGMSLGDNRDTQLYPTASALIGFLGACAGIDRNDVNCLNMWYQSWDCMSLSAHRDGISLPELMWDFQTAKDSLNTSGVRVQEAVISYRGYLQETADIASLTLRPHAEESLLDRALIGVREPVFTPYLGRLCNPLSALPWLPGEDIAVEGEATAVAEAMIDRLGKVRVELLGKDEEENGAKAPGWKAALIAPSGWLDRTWPKGKFAYRKGVPDQRLGALLSYGQRMVDVFHVQI